MISKHFLTSLIIILSFSTITIAQNNEEKEVMETIRNLFLAMESNDSTLASNSFTSDAHIISIIEKDNQYVKSSVSAQVLCKAFGSEKKQQWTEPIWNEKILINGGLASVWVDYAFYIDKNLSHCGVDAFHLIKKTEGWKIFHIADTRRKEPCHVPNSVSKSHSSSKTTSKTN